MEEEKKTKMNMSTFLLIVAMFVIICMAIFMYVQKINSDREIEILKNNGAELQEKVTELQGKMNNISNIAETEKTSDNNFSTYQTNYEKTYKNVMGKTVDGEYVADQFAGENHEKTIRVDKEGIAYYGEKMVDTNVLSVHFCYTGQDGGDIVLIHRDGTVSIIEDFSFPDAKIETKKLEKAKNIVNVISVVESGVNDIDGGWTYYLIDINGNLIDVQ